MSHPNLSISLLKRIALIAGITIVTPFASFASATEPAIKFTSSLQCSLLLTAPHVGSVLTDVLPKLVSGKPVVVNVGLLAETQELMLASGMKLRDVYIANALLEKIAQKNRGKSSVLGNTVTRLDLFKRNERELLICVMSSSCRLTYGNALHLALNNKDFAIVPFQTSDGMTSKPGWMSGGEGIPLTDFPRVIVMNGGSSTHSASWVANFLHEATHFADFQLVSEWIKANVTLIASGSMPDELFSTYVHAGANGRFEVDEGFMRVFLESRAYAAELSGFLNLVPRAEFKSMQDEQRRQAMADVRSFDVVTQFASQKLNLSEGNVFEVGERLGRSMIDSIRKAKLFGPT